MLPSVNSYLLLLLSRLLQYKHYKKNVLLNLFGKYQVQMH